MINQEYVKRKGLEGKKENSDRESEKRKRKKRKARKYMRDSLGCKNPSPCKIFLALYDVLFCSVFVFCFF